jgi:hypothetical protein
MKNSELAIRAKQRNHTKFRLMGATSIKNIPLGVISDSEKIDICTAVKLIESVLKNWDNENKKLGFSSKPIYEVTDKITGTVVYREKRKPSDEFLSGNGSNDLILNIIKK